MLHIVIGMVSDKDIDDVLGLLPEEAHYYFTQPNTPRAMAANELLSRWHHLGRGKAQAYMTAQEALEVAKNNADKDDIIFIGGSNYLVGECLPLLQG
jgi:dihydrofolate synthase/folylpolyglutamate synthase